MVAYWCFSNTDLDVTFFFSHPENDHFRDKSATHILEIFPLDEEYVSVLKQSKVGSK